MIGEITVMWLGTVSLVTTLGGILVSVNRYRQNDTSLTGLIMFGFALIFWILFTIHATSYARSLGSGVQYNVSTPSFMAVGIIGVLLSIVLLFDAALRTIKSNSATQTTGLNEA